MIIASLCSIFANSQYYEDDEYSQPRLIHYKNHEIDNILGSSSENGFMKRNDPKNSNPLTNQERKIILNKVNHLLKLLNQKKAM
jgi:hypothetical protein